MATKMATAKGHGHGGKKSGHRIHHMTVTPAENGVSVETHFHPPKGRGRAGAVGGGGMDALMGGMSPAPQTHVFQNPDDAMSHMGQQLAQNPPEEPDADDVPQKA